MAKAGAKFITWILLSGAKACADNAFQDREFAGGLLRKWLMAGELRWRSEYLEGSKRDCDPGSGDPEFCREPARSYFPSPHDLLVVINPTGNLVISWEQSRAQRNGYTFRRIEVATDDLIKLLPAGSTWASAVGKDVTKPKGWLTAEVKRMKVKREIIPSGKTEFARLLEDRIRAAALRGEVTKPVGYRHIESLLGVLKLWPIPSV